MIQVSSLPTGHRCSCQVVGLGPWAQSQRWWWPAHHHRRGQEGGRLSCPEGGVVSGPAAAWELDWPQRLWWVTA